MPPQQYSTDSFIMAERIRVGITLQLYHYVYRIFDTCRYSVYHQGIKEVM